MKSKASSGFALDLLGVAWALGSRSLLEGRIADELPEALLAIGRAMDNRADAIKKRQREAGSPQQPPVPWLDRTANQPEVLRDLPEVAVILKPPAWEVDTVGVGRGKRLSVFAQTLYADCAIVFDQGFGFGMPQRLDASSSGLVLVAKTYQAYYALRLQLSLQTLERDYVVLCHGFVPASLKVIDASLHYRPAEGTGPTRVDVHGRPAMTRVTAIAHLLKSAHHDDRTKDVTRLTLAVVRIGSGRRHQIRTHLAHAGHPCVADGKYGNVADFIRDSKWCSRTFLHRYRLGFKDPEGVACEVLASLPADLAEALAGLSPAEPESAVAVEQWPAPLLPWSSYAGLPPQQHQPDSVAVW